MKIRIIAIAASLALVSAGALLAYMAQTPVVVNEPIVDAEPRHPVTPEMTAAASSKAKRSAPGYAGEDAYGKPYSVGSPAADRPQFIYFIKDGCPCSIEVQPLFNDLAKRYQGQIDFVGIIDRDTKDARRYHTDMLMHGQIVADPKLEIIKAWDIERSAYSALVTRDGRIEKMWPGYSIEILKEMNRKFAAITGAEEKPFDTKYIPRDETSGCSFTE